MNSFNGIEFYSHDLHDAISLAHATLIACGPDTVLARADFHMADIGQYESINEDDFKAKFNMLRKLEQMKRLANEYMLGLTQN